jgi:RNA polymerase sigma-70 factor (ECF subfamily)
MSGSPKGETRNLEDYRDYLHLLGQLQLDRRLQGKIDLSGVVQQTLLEAHQADSKFSFRENDRLAAWLRQILANNLADEIRKLRTAKRDVQRERSLEAAIEHSSLRLEAWLAADQSSPSVHVQREEQAVRLSAALARLPDAQREALVMRHLRGLSLAEIAEHLGRSHDAVAGLLKRGLAQLRRDLQDMD